MAQGCILRRTGAFLLCVNYGGPRPMAAPDPWRPTKTLNRALLYAKQLACVDSQTRPAGAMQARSHAGTVSASRTYVARRPPPSPHSARSLQNIRGWPTRRLRLIAARAYEYSIEKSSTTQTSSTSTNSRARIRIINSRNLVRNRPQSPPLHHLPQPNHPRRLAPPPSPAPAPVVHPPPNIHIALYRDTCAGARLVR